MKFTSQPSNLSPVEAGLIYSFDTGCAEPRDVEVSIIEYDSDDVVGRLMLCGVTSGSFDIAPTVGRFIGARPSTEGGTILTEAPCRQFVVEIDGVRSDVLTLTDNRVETVADSWLSSMTEHRRIGYGERDEIRIFCRAGEEIDVNVVADNGMTISSQMDSDSGAALLLVDTFDFPEESRTLEVRIVCGGRSVRSIYYSIVKRYSGDLRLVWISSVGTVERYTFPVVRSIERNTVRRTVAEADGFRRTVGCESEQCVRLVSDYERRGVIAALAEIASSPAVWIEYRQSRIEAEVLTTSSTLYEYGRPCCIDIDLRIAGGKEAELW